MTRVAGLDAQHDSAIGHRPEDALTNRERPTHRRTPAQLRSALSRGTLPPLRWTDSGRKRTPLRGHEPLHAAPGLAPHPHVPEISVRETSIGCDCGSQFCPRGVKIYTMKLTDHPHQTRDSRRARIAITRRPSTTFESMDAFGWVGFNATAKRCGTPVGRSVADAPIQTSGRFERATATARPSSATSSMHQRAGA